MQTLQACYQNFVRNVRNCNKLYDSNFGKEMLNQQEFLTEICKVCDF